MRHGVVPVLFSALLATGVLPAFAGSALHPAPLWAAAYQDDVQKQIALLEEAAGKEDWTAAIAAADKIIAAKPTEAKWYVVRGRLYKDRGETGDLDKALENFAEAEKRSTSGSEKSGVRVTRSEVYQMQNKPGEALAELSRAITDAPDNYEAYLAKVRLLYQGGKLDDALQVVDEAEKAFPKDSGPTSLRIQLLTKKAKADGSDFDKTTDALSTAIAKVAANASADADKMVAAQYQSDLHLLKAEHKCKLAGLKPDASYADKANAASADFAAAHTEAKNAYKQYSLGLPPKLVANGLRGAATLGDWKAVDELLPAVVARDKEPEAQVAYFGYYGDFLLHSGDYNKAFQCYFAAMRAAIAGVENEITASLPLKIGLCNAAQGKDGVKSLEMAFEPGRDTSAARQTLVEAKAIKTTNPELTKFIAALEAKLK